MAGKKKMQYKLSASVLVGFILVLVILCALAAVALPHAGQMVYQSRQQKQATELVEIKAAVSDMLHQSLSGRLVSVGPTDDLGQVHTTDPYNWS